MPGVTRDKFIGIHENIILLSAFGSLLNIFGMMLYFFLLEFKDFKKIQNIKNYEMMKYDFLQRQQMFKIFIFISAIICLGGIAMVSLSSSLYSNEKEEIGSDISTLVLQTKTHQNLSDTNQVSIMVSIAACLIGLGLLKGGHDYEKNQSFGWLSSSMYSIGWILMCFGSSTDNHELSSINPNRFAWILPGVASIVSGTFLLPWQYRNEYVSGPSWILILLGFICFNIGNSYVKEASSSSSSSLDE